MGLSAGHRNAHLSFLSTSNDHHFLRMHGLRLILTSILLLLNSDYFRLLWLWYASVVYHKNCKAIEKLKYAHE